MANAPVEKKVTAATVGAAGSAAVVTPFFIWVVDALAFHGDGPPDVPLPIVGVIGLVVSGAAAFIAGWYARHTARPGVG